ncbi:nuclear transport factor 2 family protein [uncultured Trichococcus sp.]|uniref:nuclear transport factor 2 family protein n=1 Tax=uncultured Trichococcus sp. TaxID=189665 RepID=UPI0029C70DFA|nr:nuclear transport factor 2 family protein [uncultured Trichococcus sp.]
MTQDVQRISAQIWDAKQANDMTRVVDLIADNAHFVHMGITFDKTGELAVFNEKAFLFKAVEIAEEYVEDYGSTAIIFKKLVLTAVIGGNEVQNPFVISEVFTKTEDGWKLAAETYTRIATDFDTYQM